MTKVHIPTSPEELEDTIGDPAALAKVWESGADGFRDFVQGYAEKYAAQDRAKNGRTDEQLTEQMQAIVAGALKASAPPPVTLTASGRPHIDGVTTSAKRALYSRQAMGAAADDVFTDLADYLEATFLLASTKPGRADLAAKRGKLRDIQNSYGSEVPDAGGFLIPEVLRSQILEVALEDAVVRPRATVIPMDSLRVPIPMIDDTSHVSSIFGGVTAYWTEEAAALTESQASFGRIVLDAKKLTAYAAIPNELLQDAPAFAGFFGSTFPRAIAYYEDAAFINGNGSGQPLGFINCPASVQVTKQSGQAAKTIVWENIATMYARMLPQALNRAVWIAAPDTFFELATMALAVGVGGGPVWIGNLASPGQDTPPMTILGRPVLFTEKAPALGTTGDISFVDLSYYLLGDRMSMTSSSSEHYQFANDKTVFRVIERVDGRPWLQSAITPYNNSSNTLTPFVQIAAR